MNEKTMITLLVSSFLAGTIWLGFSTSQPSDETLKQELSVLKKELADLRLMLAKNTREEGVLKQISQGSKQSNTLRQTLSEQQRVALLTELLQMSSQEEKVIQEVDEIDASEEIRQDMIALEKE